MLVLNTGDFLAGQAADTGAVNWTLTGSQITNGAPSYMILGQGQLTDALVTLYTSPEGVQTQISHVMLTKATGSDWHDTLDEELGRLIAGRYPLYMSTFGYV